MPVTKAHIKATGKYEAKAYDKVLLRIRKDDPELNKAAIERVAAAHGQSLNSYIMQAIRDQIDAEPEELRR